MKFLETMKQEFEMKATLKGKQRPDVFVVHDGDLKNAKTVDSLSQEMEQKQVARQIMGMSAS